MEQEEINLITDAIIEFFMSPVNYLIENFGLPDVVNIVIPDKAFDTILEIIRPLGYFLPTDIIIACLLVSFTLDHFHIIWSLFLRLKSFASVHSFF